MTEPTDAEIIALADETRTAEGGASGYILPISFARAVLAKWGTPQQEAQEPCPTCTALARTVMLDQVSFDRKPDCYGIRQITDDEGVEEWEDIRTSPDVAREEANDMMATGRGEIYEVVPLWTTPQPTQAQPVACKPDFWTVCAQYEDGDKTGWIPLPWYSNETQLGVMDLVLKAVRREGYKGMASERLQELGWEIRPVYLAPQPSLQQPVPASAAEFAIRALVAAGHVTQERVDQAMALPGAPAQAGAVPLTDEQIEALPMWKRFVGLWPETRREIVRIIESAHGIGIKGGQHG